jgi:hypothetical protein
VVEYFDAVIQDLVYGDVWVVPGIDDTGSDVFQDFYGDETGRFVEDVGEVVLGKHTVCWIGGRGDGPDLVLMLRSCVNDSRRPTLELCGGCLDDWQDERRQ